MVTREGALQKFVQKGTNLQLGVSVLNRSEKAHHMQDPGLENAMASNCTGELTPGRWMYGSRHSGHLDCVKGDIAKCMHLRTDSVCTQSCMSAKIGVLRTRESTSLPLQGLPETHHVTAS